MKDKRAAGLLLFEAKPLKGLRLLQSSGAVGAAPADAAAWLRRNMHALNRDAVGDLFGLSDDFAVAVMHAYIDLVRIPLCLTLLDAWNGRSVSVALLV